MLKTTLSLIALVLVVGISHAGDAKPATAKAPVNCDKLSPEKRKACIAKHDQMTADHDARMHNDSAIPATGAPAATPSH